jgi:hypothetical protein
MPSSPASRLSAILRGAVAPALKLAGFTRAGRSFERKLEDLSWVVDVQTSRWDSPPDKAFTLNCGVFVPRVVSAYTPRKEPVRPVLADCCITARLGHLSDKPGDMWWTLTSGDAPETDLGISTDVTRRVSSHALPFLRRFLSARDVLAYLEEPRPPGHEGVWPRADAERWAYIALLRDRLGRDAAAVADGWRRSLDAARGGPVWDHIQELARRHSKGSGGPP